MSNAWSCWRTRLSCNRLTGHLLLRQMGEIWRTLDAAARRRAASCPYLLVDAGFSDPGRWQWLQGQHVQEPSPAPYASFFTVPRASAVARQVFMYAWHLAQAKDTSAQLLLGMPTHCTQMISSCTLPQIHELRRAAPGVDASEVAVESESVAGAVAGRGLGRGHRARERPDAWGATPRRGGSRRGVALAR